MNEYLTSLLVIFSEIGMLLALIAIVVGAIVYRRKRRHKAEARHFVEGLRGDEASRKRGIIDVLEKVHHMDQDKASSTAEALLKSEKRIYNDVVKIFLGHEDNDSLEDIRKDVEHMAKTYQRFINSGEQGEPVERGENPIQVANMRKQLKQMEKEKEKLEKDLAEAMDSMENMLKEYTQMYTGTAKKEGVKHIENELTQLKDKIARNVVEQVDDEEEAAETDQDQEQHPNQEHTQQPPQAGADQEQEIPELKPETPPEKRQDG